MPIQTATTGNLEDAQNIIISACRLTMEHNAPCPNLVEKFPIGQGQKQATVPKVGQATAADLTDGIEIAASQDLGLTTVDLTPNEVGLKFILTYKLLRQFNESVMKIVGRMGGDAMARKMDTDVIALFVALNGGTALGGDGKYLSLMNAMACCAYAKEKKYPNPIYAVHHPNAVFDIAKSVTPVAGTYIQGGPQTEEAWDATRRFYKWQFNDVAFFEDGNIPKISSVDSGYGAIFSKSAMGIAQSLAPTTYTDDKAALRGVEVVLVSDYGCYELDDGYGAPMTYEIGSVTTNN